MLLLRLLLLLVVGLGPLGFRADGDINETTPGSTTLGYKPGLPNYTYDTYGNGNLRTDPSRGITITYNHQDLPTSIVWANNQRLDLTYDAAGTLLRREKKTSFGSLEETRDYVGGIEYLQNGVGAKTLESIHHAEGRIRFTGAAQEWQYVLTDHLGNTRIMYADLNNNGIPEVPSEIIQEEHYYPFGMKMTGPWMGATAGAKSAYQYNGIEHLDAFDLDVNMALYRTLDPVVGRWWSVDPDVEAFTSYSSYQAMMNSPLVYNDPDGDNPLLVGAVIGVIGNGIGNLFNDRPFFQGAAQAAFFGAFAGGASNIIGGAAGLLPQGGRAAFQAGAHAFVGGSISAAQGGNFLSGAAAGAFSSVTGSIVGASGGSAGLQIAAGALAGGVGSALAGGSFWKGAAQGAIITALNHVAHRSFGPGDPPKAIRQEMHPGGAMTIHYDDGSTVFLPAQGIIHSTPSPWEYVMGGGIVRGMLKIWGTKPGTLLISQFSTRTIDEAVELVMKNSNDIGHIFATKHNLGPLVKQLGGQENTIRSVLNAANGKLPASGFFKDIPVNVGGHTIFVRGNVINGVPRIGTMFIK